MLQSRKSSATPKDTSPIRPTKALSTKRRRLSCRTIAYMSGTLTIYAALVVLALLIFGDNGGTEFLSSESMTSWRPALAIGLVICAISFWLMCIRTISSWLDLRDFKRFGSESIPRIK